MFGVNFLGMYVSLGTRFNLVWFCVLFLFISHFAEIILQDHLPIDLFSVFIIFGNLFIKFIACILCTISG